MSQPYVLRHDTGLIWGAGNRVPYRRLWLEPAEAAAVFAQALEAGHDMTGWRVVRAIRAWRDSGASQEEIAA